MLRNWAASAKTRRGPLGFVLHRSASVGLGKYFPAGNESIHRGPGQVASRNGTPGDSGWTSIAFSTTWVINYERSSGMMERTSPTAGNATGWRENWSGQQPSWRSCELQSLSFVVDSLR